MKCVFVAHLSPPLFCSMPFCCEYSVSLTAFPVLTVCHRDLRTAGCRADHNGKLCLLDSNKKALEIIIIKKDYLENPNHDESCHYILIGMINTLGLP